MGKLTKIDVNDQLNRILVSKEFSAAKRLSDFLEFIVSETIEGRAATLQAYPIALEVFDRAPSFDPQSDTIVRVQAGQLRLRLDRYYAQSGQRDPVVIKVPTGGYVPTFTARKLPDKIGTPKPEKNDLAPSIMVLPFSTLDEDARKEYFGLGLTENIISALSCFPEIVVYARNLASRKRGSGTDYIELAKRFGARFVLDGSIRHGENRLRVSGFLVDTDTSKILWNATYERDLNAADIFDIENEIATKVAAEIAGPTGDIVRHDLLESSRRSPESLSAYDTVLRSYEYWHNPSSSEHGKIFSRIKAVVRDDPSYSDATVVLSRMYLDQARFGYNIETTTERAIERAIKYAKQAIKYTPNNAVAWHLLSLAYFARHEHDLFEHAAERACSLCPAHPDILVQYGAQLWCLGQRDRGLQMAKKALSFLPVPPGSYFFVFVHDDILNGRDEQALENALMLEADGMFWMHFLLAIIYGQLGRVEEAKNALAKVFVLNPGFQYLTVDLIESWAFPRIFKDRLIDGLEKAGYVFTSEAHSG